jgi:thiosulfate/3-mercaptopyruvate sulfurtransferase
MRTAATDTEKGRWGSTAIDEVLVSAEWLEARLEDPSVTVIEVDVGRATHDAGHIEGAVLWDVYADLKDDKYRPVDVRALERLLGRSGISSESTLVFYGYAPAIGVWLMQLHGHPDVRLLDCSRDAWLAEGRPWTDVAATPPQTVYHLPRSRVGLRASRRGVRDAIGRCDTVLLDVRSDSEFTGERFWPSGGSQPGGRAGHVPSALHLPLGVLHDERGAFLDGMSLRHAFAPVMEADCREVITYCTIGGRASTAWFVLAHLLGRDNVRVYDGSWAEWGLTPGAPVATGD